MLGNPLYRIVRDPAFSSVPSVAQRPSRDRWIGGLDGVTRRVLYRLPNVLDGVVRGETVHLCEGRKRLRR